MKSALEQFSVSSSSRLSEATAGDKVVLDKCLENLGPFEKEISKTIGAPVTFKEKGVKNGAYLSLESNDLEKKSGVFEAVFQRVYVYCSNSGAKDGVVWLTADFRWEHKSGGSNGTTILTAWYDSKDNSWKFRGL